MRSHLGSCFTADLKKLLILTTSKISSVVIKYLLVSQNFRFERDFSTGEVFLTAIFSCLLAGLRSSVSKMRDEPLGERRLDC